MGCERKEAGGTVKWEEAGEAGVEKKRKGNEKGNGRGQFQRIDREGQGRALALGLATALALPRGRVWCGPAYFSTSTLQPHGPYRHTTTRRALTREVVIIKDQLGEGVADQAERLRDRAVELVHTELQPLQAGEVRADAVGNRA